MKCSSCSEPAISVWKYGDGSEYPECARHHSNALAAYGKDGPYTIKMLDEKDTDDPDAILAAWRAKHV